MAARHKKDTVETTYPYIFLVCKGLSINDVGVGWGSVFQEIRPGARSKTGDIFKEKLGGGYRKTTLNTHMFSSWSPAQLPSESGAIPLP